MYDKFINMIEDFKYTKLADKLDDLKENTSKIIKDIQNIKNNKSTYIVELQFFGSEQNLVARSLNNNDLRDRHFEDFDVVRICNNKIEVTLLYIDLKKKYKRLELHFVE